MSKDLKKLFHEYSQYRREIDKIEQGIGSPTDWTSEDSLTCYLETMWEECDVDEWIEPSHSDWIKLNIYYLAHPQYDPETKKDTRKLLPDVQSPMLYIDWHSAITW